MNSVREYLEATYEFAPEMVMCASGCSCKWCMVGKLVTHPAFKDRINQMIHEYNYMTLGPSYFPIDVVSTQDQSNAQSSRNHEY